MLGKDEKLDSEKFHYNSHLDTNDYDGMVILAGLGIVEKKQQFIYIWKLIMNLFVDVTYGLFKRCIINQLVFGCQIGSGFK